MPQNAENGMNDADAPEETEHYDEIVLCVLYVSLLVTPLLLPH